MRQQREREQAIADGRAVTIERPPAGMPEPERGEDVRHRGDAGQAERIVEQVERRERDQPHEGDETPALGLDAGDEAVEPMADPGDRRRGSFASRCAPGLRTGVLTPASPP